MSADNAIERGPWNRCKSADQEKAHRTHLCRLTNGHTQEHICICSRKWGHPKPGGAQ